VYRYYEIYEGRGFFGPSKPEHPKSMFMGVQILRNNLRQDVNKIEDIAQIKKSVLENMEKSESETFHFKLC